MTHPFVTALAGGICIGLASVLLMILLGRIAGVSGIVFNGVKSPVGSLWALFFVAGLIMGGFLFHFVSGRPFPAFDVPMPLLLTAAFIVGVGTRIGSGCTSGHGICGIGRLSVRSLVATPTFMLFAFVTVYLRLHGGLA